ncbi:hypothetical protein IPM65_03795 [Candidatus Roizmanbacteria bacterium]|nr:MAG: hypothetical protein IPM65_03795 [Candidatus Roizmanbacteria bacterium]
MAHPDILRALAAKEVFSLRAEQTVSDKVDAVIRMYFNHPSLNGYSRMRTYPEYYNPSTERFDSLLAGCIGDTYNPGEMMISARTGFIRMIRPFEEGKGVQRWEGLTLSRDKGNQYTAELVNKYYHIENGEAVPIARPVIHFPLRPEQILEEAIRVYPDFRVRYDLVR